MIKNYFAILFIFFVIMLEAQDRVPDPSLIRHGIELTIWQDYPAAENQFRELIKLSPDHPAGYLYTAAVIQAWMMDFETSDR